MLIRSQDKIKLINLDNVSEMYVERENIVARSSKNDYTEIGVYSSESKAIKVLDMIQNKYLEYYHLKGGPAILKGSIDIAENMWEVPKVFQMPQDNEVKE